MSPSTDTVIGGEAIVPMVEMDQSTVHLPGDGCAETAVFLGDHAGHLGGEYGRTGEPDASAAALRAVLAD